MLELKQTRVLRFRLQVNDYRDNLEHYDREEKQSRRPNVEAMEVWRHGRPHILLVTTRPVGKFEELLVDYGNEYWSSFLKSHHRARQQR